MVKNKTKKNILPAVVCSNLRIQETLMKIRKRLQNYALNKLTTFIFIAKTSLKFLCFLSEIKCSVGCCDT
jgi:hypothetical protein